MSKDESNGDAAGSPTTSPDAPLKDPNAEIYENRGPKKIIRVVTVMAYLFSVSFVGILLSAYYLFLWEPPNPKLIMQERLLADPQMQFLVVAAPSVEKTDVAVQASTPVSENELNQTYKTLMNRMAEDVTEDYPDIEKPRILSAMLLKLRHSLVEAQRAQNLNSSREAMTSSESDDSFVAVKEVFNSTRLIARAEDSVSGDAKNTSEEKIRSDNTNSPPELADSTLDVENTSSTPVATIPGTETNQNRLGEKSVTDVNRRAALIVHERENWSDKRKLDAAKANDITNGSGYRAYKDNNSSKVIRKFPEVDILDNKEPIKTEQNETDQLINSDRENPNNSSGASTIAMPERHVEDRTNHRLSINIVNSFRRNYFDSNYAEKITRDKVSNGSPSSRDAGFTDNPGFHQPPDEPIVVKQRLYATADSEETQIERMTTRSAIIDDKQLKEIDLSTTQRHKGLWETLTETTDIKETSVELTSVSTARNYLNFTSTANDDDESVT
ncbi:uncharacterized protein inaF-D [Linepithema humile]|uniref:uncharacterized protein inaF-D n=1 Tax=Linepithema humile TaxID=83485 RepID=UPI000623A5F2|nr:PREDICTED: uncharacterized protein LOC105672070 [Linepithema humile]